MILRTRVVRMTTKVKGCPYFLVSIKVIAQYDALLNLSDQGLRNKGCRDDPLTFVVILVRKIIGTLYILLYVCKHSDCSSNDLRHPTERGTIRICTILTRFLTCGFCENGFVQNFYGAAIYDVLPVSYSHPHMMTRKR